MHTALKRNTYTTFDTHSGSRSDRWLVEMFTKNLCDEEALVTGATTTPPVRRSPMRYRIDWPVPSRRMALRARYNW